MKLRPDGGCYFTFTINFDFLYAPKKVEVVGNSILIHFFMLIL